MKSSNATSDKAIARTIKIEGRVQGVGFRPHVYRIALQYNIRGHVKNRPDGVVIHAEGSVSQMDAFMNQLKNVPPAAVIKLITVASVPLSHFNDFRIVSSEPLQKQNTEICPDIALCNDCREELYTINRRKGYPLINCTNCGPRFTLIADLPYDRPLTSMKDFALCPQCAEEYSDPANRRFHAQPISCPSCGPVYSYHANGQNLYDFSVILSQIGHTLENGHALALKGLGGYHLACDATCAAAVQEIRKLKQRDAKPFAVMCRSLKAARQLTLLTDEEATQLNSWQRPIVVVRQRSSELLAPDVTRGLQTIGVFLPYLPLHHLIFDRIRCDYLVLTSANVSETPILCRDEEAMLQFQHLPGGLLSNNRSILRRCDDSVVKLIHHAPMLMRRSRGYVPTPVDLSFNVEGILACGAELSNTFCMGKEKQGIFSQHIGDLKNWETYSFYTENIGELSRIFKFEPHVAACDLHPDYRSTLFAQQSGLPVIQVQHHHAHIAAVMAEYHIEEPVIGLAWDGSGYGTDGCSWGSELLVADYYGFQRISHFEYLPLPGGDLAAREPWRCCLSYLVQAYGSHWNSLRIPFVNQFNTPESLLVYQAIQKKINAPLTSGAGRLFDAVAALTGVCTFNHYLSEAPMRLEELATAHTDDFYPFTGYDRISFRSTFHHLVQDLQKDIDTCIMATKFHNTLAQVALHQVKLACKSTPSRKVVLCGGSFQNRYLTEKIVYLLEQEGFQVYLPRDSSCNDSGIALGQLAVAAHKIQQACV